MLAQLLYHLNTTHINASVSRLGTTLLHHLQMLAQRRTNDCVEDHPSCYYATDVPVLWPISKQSLTALVLQWDRSAGSMPA